MSSTRNFAKTLITGRWMPASLGCISLGIAGLAGHEEMWWPGGSIVLAVGITIFVTYFLRSWREVKGRLFDCPCGNQQEAYCGNVQRDNPAFVWPNPNRYRPCGT